MVAKQPSNKKIEVRDTMIVNWRSRFEDLRTPIRKRSFQDIIARKHMADIIPLNYDSDEEVARKRQAIADEDDIIERPHAPPMDSDDEVSRIAKSRHVTRVAGPVVDPDDAEVSGIAESHGVTRVAEPIVDPDDAEVNRIAEHYRVARALEPAVPSTNICQLYLSGAGCKKRGCRFVHDITKLTLYDTPCTRGQGCRYIGRPYLCNYVHEMDNGGKHMYLRALHRALSKPPVLAGQGVPGDVFNTVALLEEKCRILKDLAESEQQRADMLIDRCELAEDRARKLRKQLKRTAALDKGK